MIAEIFITAGHRQLWKFHRKEVLEMVGDPAGIDIEEDLLGLHLVGHPTANNGKPTMRVIEKLFEELLKKLEGLPLRLELAILRDTE